MFKNLKYKRSPARGIFSVERFSGQTEQDYIAFRYENAAPILQFAYYMGGFITLALTLGELIFDGTLSNARLAYLLVWITIYLYPKDSTRTTVNLYCVYFCISIVFFIYQYYFVLERLMFLVAVINLMATAIIVAKIGGKLSTQMGLFIPLSALLMFVASGEMNVTTAKLILLLSITATVICMASVILDKSSRARFKAMVELEAAKEKEAAAGRARMQFLAFMSHEIRTPLTAIIGYAQSIIEDDIACEHQDEFITRIKTNGDHLLRLVNDILDLSRIEQGKFALNEEEVSLFEVLMDTQFSTENLAAKKHLAFEINYDFPLPQRVIVDRGRLQQILINLIGNAVKFTEEGKITLSVSADNCKLTFAVRDTGIGISEDAAQRIFESFEQENAEITRKYGGSGLGLAISKQLANLMGGELTFTSQLGKGSTFQVTVALKQAPDHIHWVNQIDDLNKQHGKSSTLQTQYAGKVLVADDVKDNRLLLQLLLEKLGIDVDLAKDGKEAVEKALVTDYDLILMDIQMPVMDGVEAVLQLREFGNETPVIATTANVMDRDIQQYRAIGFDGHLGKPIDRGVLARLLEQFLEHSDQLLEAAEETVEAEIEILRRQFLINVQAHVPTLTGYAQQKNWQGLKSIAHSLKGSASSFKFDGIAELASQIEELVLTQDPCAFDLSLTLCEQLQKAAKEQE